MPSGGCSQQSASPTNKTAGQRGSTMEGNVLLGKIRAGASFSCPSSSPVLGTQSCTEQTGGGPAAVPMHSQAVTAPVPPPWAGTHRMAPLQFSAFCAPVAAKGRAEGLRSPAEDKPPLPRAGCSASSSAAQGAGALPLEAIKFSA